MIKQCLPVLQTQVNKLSLKSRRVCWHASLNVRFPSSRNDLLNRGNSTLSQSLEMRPGALSPAGWPNLSASMVIASSTLFSASCAAGYLQMSSTLPSAATLLQESTGPGFQQNSQYKILLLCARSLTLSSLCPLYMLSQTAGQNFFSSPLSFTDLATDLSTWSSSTWGHSEGRLI